MIVTGSGSLVKNSELPYVCAVKMMAGNLAHEEVRGVLPDDERMVLAGADRDAFLDAVLNPPEPTDKLVAALKRHREALG